MPLFLIKKRCIGCARYRICRDSFVSWIFFIIGLIAAVAIRAVTVLGDLEPAYGKAAWYVGVLGFLVFFIYKFRADLLRAKAIEKAGLLDKVVARQGLTDDDHRLLSDILCGLSSNKDRINYFVIFGTSILALALAVYLDFLK